MSEGWKRSIDFIKLNIPKTITENHILFDGKYFSYDINGRIINRYSEYYCSKECVIRGPRTYSKSEHRMIDPKYIDEFVKFEGKMISKIYWNYDGLAILFSDGMYTVIKADLDYDQSPVFRLKEPDLYLLKNLDVISEEEYNKKIEELNKLRKDKENKQEYATYLRLKEKFKDKEF